MPEPPRVDIVPKDLVGSIGAGEVESAPPTFLERWGVVFVACLGGWILLISTGMLIYFVLQRPAFPSLAGLTLEQTRSAIEAHKLAEDGWRDSLSYLFDLTVTRTTLPIVTLLLGYLFGRAKGLN